MVRVSLTSSCEFSHWGIFVFCFSFFCHLRLVSIRLSGRPLISSGYNYPVFICYPVSIRSFVYYVGKIGRQKRAGFSLAHRLRVELRRFWDFLVTRLVIVISEWKLLSSCSLFVFFVSS